MSGQPRIRADNIGQVSAWVSEARRRSGMPVRDVLARLAVPASSYYRLLSGTRNTRTDVAPRGRGRCNVYELLPEERMLVLDYALAFPDSRHRALSWEMADTDVVYASPASVYRVLKSKKLVPEWRLGWPGKGKRPVPERATLPDVRWLFDLTYIRAVCRWWYLAYLMDEYSRYVVYWELMSRMDEYAVSAAVESAMAIPGRSRTPQIQTDNGPAFKSGEFRRYLNQRGIEQRRIRPHCPQDNGIIERGIRTLKELAGERFDDDDRARAEIGRAVDYYNRERRHSALYYLRPIE